MSFIYFQDLSDDIAHLKPVLYKEDLFPHLFHPKDGKWEHHTCLLTLLCTEMKHETSIIRLMNTAYIYITNEFL